MVAVGAANPQRVSRNQAEHPGLTEALDNYFKAGWGQTYSAAHANPMKAVKFFQKTEGIHEKGIGPKTTEALRRYNSNFGYAAGSTAWSRFWSGFGFHNDAQQAPAQAQTANYRGSARNPAAGLAQPAVYRTATREPIAAPSARSSGGSVTAAQALAEKTGGSYLPNHIYVVQVDQNNSASNFGALKGRTAVFTTDADGVPHQRGKTFTSSSQPSGDNPFFRGSQFADREHRYRYPYVLEGAYRMNTAADGPKTGGMSIQAYEAFRDRNMNGQIDPDEMQSVPTGAIMFHDDSAGSAGCQMIAGAEWPAFKALIRSVSKELGVNSATYILRRQNGQVWT